MWILFNIDIAAPQASPTAADVLGTQPVHQVAVTGQEEALRYLVLDLKVDVNQGTADKRLTALHYAAKVRSQSVRCGRGSLLFFKKSIKFGQKKRQKGEG